MCSDTKNNHRMSEISRLTFGFYSYNLRIEVFDTTTERKEIDPYFGLRRHKNVAYFVNSNIRK